MKGIDLGNLCLLCAFLSVNNYPSMKKYLKQQSFRKILRKNRLYIIIIYRVFFSHKEPAPLLCYYFYDIVY